MRLRGPLTVLGWFALVVVASLITIGIASALTLLLDGSLAQ